MKFKNTIVFAALLAMGVSAFAADEIKEAAKEKDHGIRVTLGSAPGWNEFELFGVGIDIDEEMGGQLEVVYQQRFWKDEQSTFAGTFGGGLFFSSNGGEFSDGIDMVEFDTGAFGLMVQGGVAGKIGSRVVYEILPYAGFGAASTDVSFNGLEDDGGGLYLMYGIKGGIFVKLADSIELGAEVGYQLQSVDIEVEGMDEWELSGDGGRVALVLNIVL